MGQATRCQGMHGTIASALHQCFALAVDWAFDCFDINLCGSELIHAECSHPGLAKRLPRDAKLTQKVLPPWIGLRIDGTMVVL